MDASHDLTSAQTVHQDSIVWTCLVSHLVHTMTGQRWKKGHKYVIQGPDQGQKHSTSKFKTATGNIDFKLLTPGLLKEFA